MAQDILRILIACIAVKYLAKAQLTLPENVAVTRLNRLFALLKVCCFYRQKRCFKSSVSFDSESTTGNAHPFTEATGKIITKWIDTVSRKHGVSYILENHNSFIFACFNKIMVIVTESIVSAKR